MRSSALLQVSRWSRSPEPRSRSLPLRNLSDSAHLIAIDENLMRAEPVTDNISLTHSQAGLPAFKGESSFFKGASSAFNRPSPRLNRP